MGLVRALMWGCGIGVEGLERGRGRGTGWRMEMELELEMKF